MITTRSFVVGVGLYQLPVREAGRRGGGGRREDRGRAPVILCRYSQHRMKIDVFCHILPPPYFERMLAISGRSAHLQKRVREIPVMVDLDLRLRMMDGFGDYVQVLSLAAPPIEVLAGPRESPDLARLANDGMAEI